jgi:hypothetical protein
MVMLSSVTELGKPKELPEHLPAGEQERAEATTQFGGSPKNIAYNRGSGKSLEFVAIGLRFHLVL